MGRDCPPHTRARGPRATGNSRTLQRIKDFDNNFKFAEGSVVSTKIPTIAYPLLDGKNFGHLATLMPDGSPQTTVVWVERDGDAVLLNVAKGRVKYYNMLRDPRVALSVHSQDNPSMYIQIRGYVELIEENADAHVHRLSRKYVGRDYSDIDTDPQRVIVHIVPESVHFHHHG